MRPIRFSHRTILMMDQSNANTNRPTEQPNDNNPQYFLFLSFFGVVVEEQEQEEQEEQEK